MHPCHTQTNYNRWTTYWNRGYWIGWRRNAWCHHTSLFWSEGSQPHQTARMKRCIVGLQSSSVSFVDGENGFYCTFCIYWRGDISEFLPSVICRLLWWHIYVRLFYSQGRIVESLTSLICPDDGPTVLLLPWLSFWHLTRHHLGSFRNHWCSRGWEGFNRTLPLPVQSREPEVIRKQI